VSVSDVALARRVGAGDERAFEELYRRYADSLYRYCLSMLGSREEAEEALQSAMFSAYRSLHGNGREVQVRAWLYRIAHNQCVDRLRRQRPSDALTGLEEERRPRPEEQVILREDLHQLRRDLAALAPEQRAALVLREMAGLSHAEIAQALETTTGVAKQLIHDAREGIDAFERGRRLACVDIRRRISDADGRVMRGRAIRGHLRACADCADFRAEVARRRRRLESLFPPLAPPAAQGILDALLGGGAGGGGTAAVSGGLGSAGLASGLALKAGIAGIVALTATAGVSFTGLADRITGSGGSHHPSATHVSHATTHRAVPSRSIRPSAAASRATARPRAPTRRPRSGAGPPTPRGASAALASPARAPTASPAAAAPVHLAAASGAPRTPSAGSTARASVTASAHTASARVSARAGRVGADVNVSATLGTAGAPLSGGPASAAVSANVPSGSAGATVSAGPVSVGAGADASGTAGATVSAPPATASVSADTQSPAASATASAPAASAGAAADAHGAGVTVSTPVAGVTVSAPGPVSPPHP